MEQLPLSPQFDSPYLLYADDDPDDIDIVTEMLQSIDAALHITTVLTGKEVFEMLEGLPAGGLLPALIVLDMNMPGWDGLQTLNTIKARDDYAQIPVYIFSNSDHPKHREAAMAAGAKAFLTKPYDQEKLVEICMRFAGYIHQPAKYKL